jgi:Ca2+-binding EF-hand superfamily protein
MSPITKGEFVDNLNDLVGSEPSDDVVRRLVNFIGMALSETPEQREERIANEAHMKEEADWEKVVNGLFDKWDNDCSFFIDAFELSMLYRVWKKCDEETANAFAVESLAFVGLGPDGVLTRAQFARHVCH